jgi:hypothetical protein
MLHAVPPLCRAIVAAKRAIREAALEASSQAGDAFADAQLSRTPVLRVLRLCRENFVVLKNPETTGREEKRAGGVASGPGCT